MTRWSVVFAIVLVAVLASWVSASEETETLVKAKELAFQGKFTDAASLLEEIMDNKETPVEVFEELVRYYYLVKDNSGVIEITKEIKSRFPESMAGVYYSSRVYVDEGNDAAAETLLEEVLAKDPNHHGALVSLGLIWKRRATPQQPDNPDEGEAAPVAEPDEALLAKANELFEKAKALEITSADDMEMRAVLFLMNDDATSSVEFINKALELNPFRPSLLITRCFLLFGQASESQGEDKPDPMEDCRRGLELETDPEAKEGIMQLMSFMQMSLEYAAENDGDGASEDVLVEDDKAEL